MDADIAGLYAEAGIEGVRTRFVGPIIDLARAGPLTVKELAERRKVTHSAMSQATEATVRALDAELPYPIMQVVADIRAALAARPFAQRLREQLAGELP